MPGSLLNYEEEGNTCNLADLYFRADMDVQGSGSM
jgi:hypothetical protein